MRGFAQPLTNMLNFEDIWEAHRLNFTNNPQMIGEIILERLILMIASLAAPERQNMSLRAHQKETTNIIKQGFRLLAAHGVNTSISNFLKEDKYVEDEIVPDAKNDRRLRSEFIIFILTHAHSHLIYWFLSLDIPSDLIINQENNETLLFEFARKGKIELFEALIYQYNANINHFNSNNKSPLDVLYENIEQFKFVAVIEKLIRHQSKIQNLAELMNKTWGNRRQVLLSMAIENDAIEENELNTTLVFLKTAILANVAAGHSESAAKKICTEVKDAKGYTPVMVAIKLFQIKTVELLVQTNADVLLQADNDNYSLLDLATIKPPITQEDKKKYDDMIDFLLSHNSKFNVFPLSEAINKKNWKMVQLMLHQGATLNADNMSLIIKEIENDPDFLFIFVQMLDKIPTKDKDQFLFFRNSLLKTCFTFTFNEDDHELTLLQVAARLCQPQSFAKLYNMGAELDTEITIQDDNGDNTFVISSPLQYAAISFTPEQYGELLLQLSLKSSLRINEELVEHLVNYESKVDIPQAESINYEKLKDAFLHYIQDLDIDSLSNLKSKLMTGKNLLVILLKSEPRPETETFSYPSTFKQMVQAVDDKLNSQLTHSIDHDLKG